MNSIVAKLKTMKKYSTASLCEVSVHLYLSFKLVFSCLTVVGAYTHFSFVQKVVALDYATLKAFTLCCIMRVFLDQ